MKRLKTELKATYVKVDDESRARAVELRALLEDAVKDLDDYHNLLVTAKVPVDSVKEKVRSSNAKNPEGKKVKSTKDSDSAKA